MTRVARSGTHSRMPAPIVPLTPDAILAFIAEHPAACGKREIARAFGLSGADKIALKAMLRDMEADGRIERSPSRDYHRGGGLPRVTVLRVIDVDEGGRVHAIPDRWEQAGDPPRVRVIERARASALGLGDRILARIEDGADGMRAHPMKRIERRADTILGVLRAEGDRLWLTPADKKLRHEIEVSDPGAARAGELVLAEPSGRPPRVTARVVDVLGDPFAPRAFSLIAVNAKAIPHVFGPAAIEEAQAAAHAPLGDREDLTQLPFLTIDPVDARDHDDAVWAAAHADKPGHTQAIVAIADVGWFVRPGTALDRAARERGNSVYFPDRVIPMLPETLSADACSLVQGEPRAVIACHLDIAPDGRVGAHRFTRARIRCVANLPYEEAQASIDAGAGEHHALLAPLWDGWRSLARARAARAPLELDLPERRVTLDAAGNIAEIGLRERLDAHRLIEEYMIAANVAAAQALDARKAPCVYRDHEPPGREKLIAFKDYLATFALPFALGQVIRPAVFNRVIERVRGRDEADEIAEQVLRTQTQAYYAPVNTGHFGLALGQYAHFTSPIRRYSDLLVHRALVSAYALGEGGMGADEAAALPRTCEHISVTERRAMEAERETMDRYVARHLSTRVGELVEARVTGVARFGLFAQLEGVGGDGLCPMSAMGDERFRFDQTARAIEGELSGDRFTIGQRLQLRLVDANPVTGALRFERSDGGRTSAPTRRDRKVRRGR